MASPGPTNLLPDPFSHGNQYGSPAGGIPVDGPLAYQTATYGDAGLDDGPGSDGRAGHENGISYPYLPEVVDSAFAALPSDLPPVRQRTPFVQDRQLWPLQTHLSPQVGTGVGVHSTEQHVGYIVPQVDLGQQDQGDPLLQPSYTYDTHAPADPKVGRIQPGVNTSWPPFTLTPMSSSGTLPSLADVSTPYHAQVVQSLSGVNGVGHTTLSPMMAGPWAGQPTAPTEGGMTTYSPVTYGGPLGQAQGHGPIRTMSVNSLNRRSKAGSTGACSPASPYSVSPAGLPALPTDSPVQLFPAGTLFGYPASSSLSVVHPNPHSHPSYALPVPNRRASAPVQGHMLGIPGRAYPAHSPAGIGGPAPALGMPMQRIHPAPLLTGYGALQHGHGHIHGSAGGVRIELGGGQYGVYHAMPVEEAKPARFKPTKEQLAILVDSYNQNKNPDAATREALAKRLGDVKPKTLQIWFQNRRSKSRAKEREAALPRHLSLGGSKDLGGRKGGGPGAAGMGFEGLRRASMADLESLRGLIHEDDTHLSIIPVSVLSISTWTRFLTPGHSTSPDLAAAVRLPPSAPSGTAEITPELSAYVVHSGQTYRVTIPLTVEAIKGIEAAANPGLNADAVLVRFEVQPGVAAFAGWNEAAGEWRRTGDFSGGVVGGGGKVEITGLRETLLETFSRVQQLLFNVPLPTPVKFSHNHHASSVSSTTASLSPSSPFTPTPTTTSMDSAQFSLGSGGMDSRNSLSFSTSTPASTPAESSQPAAPFGPGWRFPNAAPSSALLSADNTPIEPFGPPPHLRLGGAQAGTGVHGRAGRKGMGHCKQRSLSAPIAKPAEFEAVTPTRPYTRPDAIAGAGAGAGAGLGDSDQMDWVGEPSTAELTWTTGGLAKGAEPVSGMRLFGLDLATEEGAAHTPPFILDDEAAVGGVV